MGTYEDIEERLVGLGLPGDEVRAYVTLLRLGRQKASRVAEAAELSRPKTYEALDGLRRQGLVTATTGRPRLHEAADPERLFEYLQGQRRGEIEEIQHVKSELLDAMKTLAQPADRPAGEPRFDLVRKRPAVLGSLHRIVEQADQTLELIVSHPAGLQILDVDGAWEAIIGAMSRGVAVRLVVSPAETGEANRRLLAEAGASIELRRIADLPACLFAISDGTEVLVTLIEDASARPNADSPVAFVTNAEAFVEVQRRAFQTCWQAGEDASDEAAGPESGTNGMTSANP